MNIKHLIYQTERVMERMRHPLRELEHIWESRP